MAEDPTYDPKWDGKDYKLYLDADRIERCSQLRQEREKLVDQEFLKERIKTYSKNSEKLAKRVWQERHKKRRDRVDLLFEKNAEKHRERDEERKTEMDLMRRTRRPSNFMPGYEENPDLENALCN